MLFDPDHHRQRAVVRHIGLAAGTPVEIVRALRAVDWRIALIALALAATATAFATAIVVGNDVVLAIRRIAAGADPGDIRLHGARRTTAGGATTTATDKTIDGTVPPVFAAVRIALFVNAGRRKCTSAIDRQQCQCASTDQQGTEPAEKAAPRSTARSLPGQLLRELI